MRCGTVSVGRGTIDVMVRNTYAAWTQDGNDSHREYDLLSRAKQTRLLQPTDVQGWGGIQGTFPPSKAALVEYPYCYGSSTNVLSSTVAEDCLHCPHPLLLLLSLMLLLCWCR